MAEKKVRTPLPSDGFTDSDLTFEEEVQLALRNREMPLEGLRYPVTPAGMHYLLIHYDIPEVTTAEWRLTVGGLVSRSMSLSLEEIRRRDARTVAVTLECAGNGRALLAPRRISQPWLRGAIGTAEWTGIPLREILEEAGVRDDAAEVVFTGLDRGVEGDEVQHYQRSLQRNEALGDEVLLVYAMNGEPLPPQHGHPLRLLVPGWYGMASVKWLERIEAVAEPFEGYQMAKVYRYWYSRTKEGPGDAITLIRVRALMIPPGIPDFLTRGRRVAAGAVPLSGKAWAGRREVSRVEVSVDGGVTWSDAQLGEPVSAHAWVPWSFRWTAERGIHTLCVRATDSDGVVRPMEQKWNYGGYGNNSVQRVIVKVE